MTGAVTNRIVVVPAAPALAPGIGADLPPGFVSLLEQGDRVLKAALAGESEVDVLAAPDPPFRDLEPPTAAQASRLDRADVRNDRTGWAVAMHLLDRAGYPGLRRRVRAGEGDLGSVAVVVAADGSAATGPRSPRASAAGAAFDEHLERSLRTGRVADLAVVTDTAAARVGCTTAAAWRSVTAAAAGAEWDVVAFEREAPYGVTSFLAHLVRSR